MSKLRWPNPAHTTAQTLLGSRLITLQFLPAPPVSEFPAIFAMQGRVQPTRELRVTASRLFAVVFVPQAPPATRPIRTPGKQPLFGPLPGSRFKFETPPEPVPTPFVSLPLKGRLYDAITQELQSRIKVETPPAPAPTPFVPLPLQGRLQVEFGFRLFDSRLIAGAAEAPVPPAPGGRRPVPSWMRRWWDLGLRN